MKIWQKAVELAVRVNREALACLPEEEKLALAHHLRTSSQNVPANIAEGYGRHFYEDSIRLYDSARGSVEETKSHLALAFQLGYIDEACCHSLMQEYEGLINQINTYILSQNHGGSRVEGPGTDNGTRIPHPGAKIRTAVPEEPYDRPAVPTRIRTAVAEEPLD